ncbi:MAG: adenylyltransferase/cytidyltransferase family protein [Acidobacteriota bacterium]
MSAIPPGHRSSLHEALNRMGWRQERLGDEWEHMPPGDLNTALTMSLVLAGVTVSDNLEVWQHAVYKASRRRLFPSRFGELADTESKVAEYFFPLAQAVLEEQVRRAGKGIAVRLPFHPLEESEIVASPSGEEYRRLVGLVEQDTLLVCYAMAQQWLGYSIADHILGVTGLALWIGRQLARVVPVDLPLLHGASIGHDVGKFGCLGDEERRIPRLHYYYTHQWYASRNLPSLGHIATNHSTWDLEQVRLPVETQLLIYADFRVKDAAGPDGRPRMSIISLREAFGAIRDKLENLDRAKIARYQAVYRRLRDLEDYLLHLGVELDMPGFDTGAPPKPDLPRGLAIVDVLAGRQRPDVIALASGQTIATAVRLFTTAHNIGVMERLRDVPALRVLLEEARSFEGWRDLRIYIGILGEYSAALSMEQKELALDFFFELLSHRDDDVRYHASNRIGDLLALGEDFWRKDLPDGIVPENGSWVLGQLDRVLSLLELASPEAEEDMGPTERVVYAVPVILRRLIRHAEASLRAQALERIFANLSQRVHDRRPLVGLYVCESFEVLLPYLTAEQKLQLPEIALAWAHHEVENTRLMAWRLLVGLARETGELPELLPGVRYAVELLSRRISAGMLVAELHLLEEMAARSGVTRLAERCRELRETDRAAMREVLLRNLKARVGWVEKKVNCDYLRAAALTRVQQGQDPESYFAAEVAAHLANMLKVSRVEGTRFHAGRCLLEISRVLAVPQRNDLMVELIRSLQLDVVAITRYIPRFLGAILATLPEQEFDEALDDIELHVRRGSELLQQLLLQTVGWVIASLPVERLRDGVLRRLAGILLGALAETRTSTVHEGYAQIAMVLDRLAPDSNSSAPLTLFLRMVSKSVLSLITHPPGDTGRFLLIASALNHMDRAMSQSGRRLRFPKRPPVAFLPGTFDPFTRAHADVVTRVLAQVDEVLVQVDDYSWRKHTQPRQVRKELAWMALASIPEAFEAPFEPPVNLANPDSVRQLVRRLGRREVWIVVGTDVLEGASAYRDPESPIWDLAHLVVVRENHSSQGWQDKLGRFRGRVQVVNVPPRAKAISSTTLREALDSGDDLELLCDPLVGRTLLERRLYVNYPSTKDQVRPPRYSLRIYRSWERVPPGLSNFVQISSLPPAARWAGRRFEVCAVVARDGGAPLAAVSWREVTAAALPVELNDPALAVLPERRLIGPGALVDTFAAGGDGAEPGGYGTLLSRVMARWLDAGLLFALAAVPARDDGPLWRALQEYGACWLSDRPDSQQDSLRWAAVRLSDPLVLVWDLEQALQPPYAAEQAVVDAIAESRRALARYFADRAPGNGMLHLFERETKRVVVEWARERLADQGRKRNWVVLGLGRQFHRDIVGECPTLAIDLERFLTWQGYEGGVHPAVGSPPLELQLHTAKELGRDALLLAPFLDSEEPVLRVQAAARAAGVVLREVLVGVTSASVHAALHLQGILHHCGAVLPRWQGVIRESALMPYLGGWSILGRHPLEIGSLRPSLNDCLPYHHPHPLGLDDAAALDFSRLVLDHSCRLLRRLEEIFRSREGRLLGLLDLAAVVRTPRCPPFPQGFVPPRGRVPSELLSEDLEALARLHPESHQAHKTRWRLD